MNDLDTLAAQLAEAKADLAHWERLASAADRVKALVASYDKAKAAQAKADEAAAKAEREARYAGIDNLRVTSAVKSRQHDETAGPLHRQYTIHWTAPRHDMYSGENVPTEQSCAGFSALPEPVFMCLIEKHPDRIPAEIMALRPGDPWAALNEYLIATQRGYIKGAAA